MATLGHNAAFDGATIASIQDTFHFDTNEFLAPEDGECPPLDYDELFSILREPIARGSGESSGGAPPIQSGDSGVWVASPAPSPSSATPALQPLGVGPPVQPHGGTAQSKHTAPKSVRDTSFKRVRDINTGKSKESSNGRNKDNGNGKNKQCQVKELEALAAKKSEDLERLQRENDELKFRKQVLEKVVQLREHQLKVMRECDDDLPQSWGTSSTVPQAPAASVPTTCGAPTPYDVPAVTAVRTASCGCLLGASGVNLPAVNRQRFQSMGKTQLMQGWKHFLSEVAVPLLALESNPEDEAAASQIRQLATEATFLFKHASLLAPDTVMVVSQTHLETEMLTAADPSHWRTVVRTLELTSDQMRELVAVFRLFTGIMRGVLAERKVINEHLATGLHHPHSDVQAAMEKLTVSPECQMMQMLQRSMRREKSAHLLLRGFMFGHTLSILQFVKAAVYAYPWFPDATALVATVAEMVGDAEGARSA